MVRGMGNFEDRTDPYRVKARRHRLEHHDHRDGMCDLLSEPDRVGWRDGECFLEADYHNPEMRCSCDLCSAGAKEEGRKKRHAGKREARDWDKE